MDDCLRPACIHKSRPFMPIVCIQRKRSRFFKENLSFYISKCDSIDSNSSYVTVAYIRLMALKQVERLIQIYMTLAPIRRL